MTPLPRQRKGGFQIMLNVALYALGAAIYLYLQLFNSIKSTSNGLSVSISGGIQWLKVQQANLLARVFLQAVLYLPIVQLATTKVAPALEAAGLSNYVWGYAGIAGLGSAALAYQIIGLIPGLRAEIPELAPTQELAERRAAGEAPQPPLPSKTSDDSNPTGGK